MREGLLPTVIGAGVTAATATMRLRDMRGKKMKRSSIIPMAQTALLGFGLAHVVLGTIDMVQHRK